MAAVLCLTGASNAQGTGYWHANGNRILDTNNQPVRITGIDWYGLEGATGTIGGLYVQDYKVILQTVKAQGFNTIRIPLSSQMIETPNASPNIAFYNSGGPINSDLKGLNSLEVLDSVINYAGSIGVRVILDHHRSEAGASAEQNGLWYTAQYPESSWIADWTALANRYLGEPTVIGFDLHNEPHAVKNGGACWDCGGENDWHLAAERAGNAVLAVNPNLLIFVEGTDVYNGDYYWWGGNLEGVAKSPVTLFVPNHLVYSAHDYGPREQAQTWFHATTSYSSLADVWTKHWSYISQENIAPVWVGEFGTTNNAADMASSVPGTEGQWFESLIQFLKANPNLSWSYWALNGEDQYGLLDSHYNSTPVSATKASMLSGIRSPLFSAISVAAAPTKLSASPVSASQVSLAWSVVAGSGVTFALFFGTASGHTDTVLAKNISTTIYQASNLNPETNYFFTVKAINEGIASAPSNEASAMTKGFPAPAAPSQVVAVPASTTQINVTWKPSPTAGITYTVYGGTGSNSLANVIAAGLSSPNYLVTGLTPATTYYFAVKALIQGSSSGPSPVASAITKSLPAPASPTSLMALAASANKVNLSWTASSTKGVTYSVYSGRSPDAMTSLVASGISGTTYTVTALSASTAYYFIVKAVQGPASSNPSNLATATTGKAAAAQACHVSYRSPRTGVWDSQRLLQSPILAQQL